MNIPFKPLKIEKVWGYELWIHNDSQYCGKLLVFPKEGNNFSMHYHMIKTESWYVQQGRFQYDWIDTETAKLYRTILNEGDAVYVEKGNPHQLTALEDDSIIFEVSTQHFETDSYRIYRDTPDELYDKITYVPNINK